ncbi:hypothetical protein ACF1A5_11475 [Streptomyces sp. NPDC014864]|uniref:hypothetical protein n=1 Tax=Streptomyces sp. NPDC014864 TaxID=3364924 RepID=UPI0036FFEFCE
MRHTESVGRVTDYRLVPGPKYVTVELDYTTAGGVKKTLKLAHCEAEQIRTGIASALEDMPVGPRRGSFFNSLRRKR